MFAILDKDHNIAAALLLKRAIEYKPEENVSLKSNNWIDGFLVENGIVQRSKTGIMKGLERYSVVQLHRHQNMLLYHLGNGMYEPSHVINMDETSMQQVLLASKTLGKKVQRNVSGTGDCRRGVHHTNVLAVAMDGTKLALLFIFKSKEGDEIPQIQVIQVGADVDHATLAIAKPTRPPKAPVAEEQKRGTGGTDAVDAVRESVKVAEGADPYNDSEQEVAPAIEEANDHRQGGQEGKGLEFLDKKFNEAHSRAVGVIYCKDLNGVQSPHKHTEATLSAKQALMEKLQAVVYEGSDKQKKMLEAADKSAKVEAARVSKAEGEFKKKQDHLQTLEDATNEAEASLKLIIPRAAMVRAKDQQVAPAVSGRQVVQTAVSSRGRKIASSVLDSATQRKRNNGEAFQDKGGDNKKAGPKDADATAGVRLVKVRRTNLGRQRDNSDPGIKKARKDVEAAERKVEEAVALQKQRIQEHDEKIKAAPAKMSRAAASALLSNPVYAEEVQTWANESAFAQEFKVTNAEYEEFFSKVCDPLEPPSVEESNRLLSKSFVAFQENAYMTSELMIEYLNGPIKAYRQSLPIETRDNRLALIFDRFAAHLTADVLAYAAANNIDIFLIPTGTTDLVQVLDKGVMGPFKWRCKEVRLAESATLSIESNKKLDVSIERIVHLETVAFRQVKPSSITNSWIGSLKRPQVDPIRLPTNHISP